MANNLVEATAHAEHVKDKARSHQKEVLRKNNNRVRLCS